MIYMGIGVFNEAAAGAGAGSEGFVFVGVWERSECKQRDGLESC